MKTSSAKKSSKEIVIWAVDPNQDPKDAVNVVKELKTWARMLDCAVQPVVIATKSAFNLPINLGSRLEDELKLAAQKKIEKYLVKANATGFLPPEVRFISSTSIRKLADDMAKAALQKKALLVFANSRARKSWNPFSLGSFSTALISVSRTPVLLLNSKAQAAKKVSSILFPTDFSRNSRNALANVMPWAKLFKSKIVLFNQVETPSMYAGEANGYWESENFLSLVKGIEKSRIKKANKWSQIVSTQGIGCKNLVEKQKKSLSQDIVNVAKKENVSLIAIASHSGPIMHAILGNVARDVLLKAHCPVLIFYRPVVHRKLEESKSQEVKPEATFPSEEITYLPEIHH